jgi:diguanylate cyclase (GGDEF)-like protein
MKKVALAIPDGWGSLIRPLLGTLVAFFVVWLGKIILEQHVRFKTLSIRDALTGLYNRHFMENLRIIISKAARYDEFVFICFIDINKFKFINDTYGHKAGDNALKVIAKTLTNNTRAEDVVIRYGGDEFIIFWISSNLTKSEQFIQKITASLSHITFFHNEQEVALSATVGFNSDSAREVDVLEKLLEKADTAMLQSKKADG